MLLGVLHPPRCLTNSRGAQRCNAVEALAPLREAGFVMVGVNSTAFHHLLGAFVSATRGPSERRLVNISAQIHCKLAFDVEKLQR